VRPVVPVNPRHPLIVAALAQNAQASDGRFSLGLGLGAPDIERQTFGIPPPIASRGCANS
jgi:alkanesulfonate monooxygenase SsuD/methylene tetrahydromethanopterin reductase-like flavin-dependent oxidoreductase (luciferase family)